MTQLVTQELRQLALQNDMKPAMWPRVDETQVVHLGHLRDALETMHLSTSEKISFIRILCYAAAKVKEEVG